MNPPIDPLRSWLEGGAPGFLTSLSGLIVPETGAVSPIMEFMGVFMTVTEYIPFQVEMKESPAAIGAQLIGHLLPTLPSDQTMFALAALNHFAHHPDQDGPAVETLRAWLTEIPLERFDRLRANQRVFARQPVLNSMRALLRREGEPATPPPIVPSGVGPILLVHAMGDVLTMGEHSGPSIGGLAENIVLNILANWTFHEGDDRFSLIVRTLTLWRDHGERIERRFPGKDAIALLGEATGLEPEDFLALGFALISHAVAWTPEVPQLFSFESGVRVEPEKIQKFIERVSASPERFGELFAETPASGWDLLPFEGTPVLRLSAGYLVLDETLLWDRITSGLFWFVFDHLKTTPRPSDALRWMEAWGDMVEAAVGEIVSACSILTLDHSRVFWDEDDLRDAYGADERVVDYTLDFGESFVLFEVVSHRITTKTRINLSRASFDNDIEISVMNKARQLSNTGRLLLDNEFALTGFPPAASRTVWPVIVAAMGFPYIQPVVTHINELVAAEGLFRRQAGEAGSFKPLCVIDLRELELLESLAAIGRTVPDVLNAWQTETDGGLSLWNWASGQDWLSSSLRSPRIRERGKMALNGIRSRLVGDDLPPWEPEEGS